MKKQILPTLLLITLILPVITYAQPLREKPVRQEVRLENRLDRLEQASSTRAQIRQENILRLQTRLASTTAERPIDRVNQINERLAKHQENMQQVRLHILEREIKIVSVLEKIASKIDTRINILTERGLNLTEAKSKLNMANDKLAEVIVAADKLTDILDTDITAESDQDLLLKIREARKNIKELAKETHALLVNTVKEISQALAEQKNTDSVSN